MRIVLLLIILLIPLKSLAENQVQCTLERVYVHIAVRDKDEQSVKANYKAKIDFIKSIAESQKADIKIISLTYIMDSAKNMYSEKPDPTTDLFISGTEYIILKEGSAEKLAEELINNNFSAEVRNDSFLHKKCPADYRVTKS